MNRDVAERFAEVDGYIADMDRRLTVIARQNAVLGEMVEVLGRYVNATVDTVQHHVQDDH
ncbi:MAG: hypothetical protein QOJ32_2620 [Frankiaceae bacterium]|jgi:hypothetical protein|nr:hypothetical protein [Frankiaceae bacterium]